MILFLGSVDDARKARDYSPRLFVHRHGVQNRRSAIASVPLELALPGHRVRPPLGEGAKRLRGNTLPPVSLFKAASTVSLLTLASRITGLVRELLMASVFGVSAMTDAFNVSFRIPNLFRRVLGEGAFSQAFVPVLSATRAQEGEESARALIDHVGTLLAWTLVLLCIAGVLGAPWMVWGMASGLKQSPQGFDAAVTMTRWMFPYIGFMSLVALAGGILNTWKKFAVPGAAPGVAAAHWGALGGHSCRLVRPHHAQSGTADAARAAGGERGADIPADQYADCLAPAHRQRELDHLRRPPDGAADRAAGRGAGCGTDAATGQRPRQAGRRPVLGHARLGAALGGAVVRALHGGLAGLFRAAGGGAVPLWGLWRSGRAPNHPGTHGLWRGPGGHCGHQGAGAGLLCQT